MKPFLLLIFLFGSSQLSGQWTVIKTFPNQNFSDIETLSENKVFVAGTDSINGIPIGVLHSSLDGGITWNTVHFEDTDRIYSISIINSDVIYANSRGSKVYKTINGGLDWNLIPPPSTDPGVAIGASYFIDEQTGFIGNFYGELFRTTDGGQTWELVYFGQAYRSVLDVNCPSENICFASTVISPHFLKSP